MLTINAAFDQCEKYIGLVGRWDEGGTRQIIFDCTEILEEYPTADIICVLQRPKDRSAYLATTTMQDKMLTLVLGKPELAAFGILRIELRAMVGEDCRKSATFTATVAPSLRGQDDRPGNPVPDSLNRIKAELAAAEETRADLVKALDGVDEAVEKATTAAASADAATEAANAAEEKRAAAETQRESDFKAAITASETAQGNAQAAAENAEKAAQNAENATTKADAAEEKREAAEAERVSAENARVSSETARAAAETARASAETARASAETARAEAETKRETDTAAAIAVAENATTDATTAAANAQAAADKVSGMAFEVRTDGCLYLTMAE